jgi:hypothetical protein
MSYYRKKRKSYKKNKGHEAAITHIIARQSLSRLMGGIDKDVEEIFFQLPPYKLSELLQEYGREFGEKAESYARETYPLWKHKRVKMSGLVAERLLNLIPSRLDSHQRFDLIKKLRSAHIKKQNLSICCQINAWENPLVEKLNSLLHDARIFAFPESVVNCAKWISCGDAIAAQKLLKAAEEEEALIYASFIKNEINQIKLLAENTNNISTIYKRIEIPQGIISLTIEPPKKTFVQWLFGT